MVQQVELNVVLDVADWLAATGLAVYHERKIPDRPSRGVFSVDEAERGRRPDLLVCGEIVGGGRSFPGSYVAVEVKPGNRHKDILDGFDAVLRYFTDYACGAKYLIGGSPVDITAIVLVTSFGPRGHLFKEEAKFNPRGIVHGPWDAYPMTFTVARLLWRQRDNIAKRLQETLFVPGGVNLARRGAARLTESLPDVGVMVSDPRRPDSVLLMLSRRPYHWHLRPTAASGKAPEL